MTVGAGPAEATFTISIGYDLSWAWTVTRNSVAEDMSADTLVFELVDRDGNTQALSAVGDADGNLTLTGDAAVIDAFCDGKIGIRLELYNTTKGERWVAGSVSRLSKGYGLESDASTSAALTIDPGNLTLEISAGVTSGGVSQAYVDNAIATVVGAAPVTLDTLAEISAALAADPDFATTITTQLAGKEPAQTAASQAEMEAGTEAATRSMSPLRVKQAIDAHASGGSSSWPTGQAVDANIGYRIPGFQPTVDMTEVLVADQARYGWWYSDTPGRITDLMVGVQASSGTTMRVAVIQADGTDWQPANPGLVGQTTLDPSSTGDKTAGGGLTWDYDPGLLITLLVADGTPTVYALAGALCIGGPFDPSGGSLAIGEQGIRNSLGTGILSDPVPDWTSINRDDWGVMHMVGFKIEAQP